MFIHHANSSHGIARSSSREKKIESLILYFTLCHSGSQILVANGCLTLMILYCIHNNETSRKLKIKRFNGKKNPHTKKQSTRTQQNTTTTTTKAAMKSNSWNCVLQKMMQMRLLFFFFFQKGVSAIFN